jgi:hypothetical protein
MIIRKARSAAVPLTACEQLAILQAQQILIASGQAVQEIDTPQLGRVTFSQANMGDLQRLIDQYTAACARENGQPCASGRKPISFEAWP